MNKYIDKKWLALLALITMGENAHSSNWREAMGRETLIAERDLASRIARDTANAIANQASALQRVDDDNFFTRSMRTIQRSIDDAKRRVNDSHNTMDQDMNELESILNDMNLQLVDMMAIKREMHNQSENKELELRNRLTQIQLKFSNTVTHLALVGAHG